MVRGGWSRALFGLWAALALGHFGARAKVAELGAMGQPKPVTDSLPSDIPDHLIHREYARRQLDRLPAGYFPKLIVPIAGDVRHPGRLMAHYSDAMRHRADGSERPMDIYFDVPRQDRASLERINALANSSRESLAPLMAKARCKQDSSCEQEMSALLASEGVRTHAYNVEGPSEVLARFINETSHAALGFVPANNALYFAQSRDEGGVYFIPLGGVVDTPRDVPKDRVAYEVANHGVAFKCMSAARIVSLALDSGLWTFMPHPARKDALAFLGKNFYLCIDFPSEEGVPISKANVTYCNRATIESLELLLEFARQYGSRMHLYAPTHGAVRVARASDSVNAPNAAPSKPEPDVLLSSDVMLRAIRELLAHGVTIRDLEAERSEQERAQASTRTGYALGAAGLAIAAYVARTPVAAAYKQYQKSTAKTQARQQHADMLKNLAKITKAAASAKAASTSGTSAAAHAASTAAGGGANAQAEDDANENGHWLIGIDLENEARERQERRAANEAERKHQGPQRRVPKSQAKKQRPEIAQACEPVRRKVIEFTQEELAAAWPKYIEFDNVDQILAQIDEACRGARADKSGGGGHRKYKHYGLNEVFDISRHNFDTYKKSDVKKANLTLARWWAWNLKFGMPPTSHAQARAQAASQE